MEVTQGLDVGDVVVLADLGEALPSGDEQSLRFRAPGGVTGGRFTGPPSTTD